MYNKDSIEPHHALKPSQMSALFGDGARKGKLESRGDDASATLSFSRNPDTCALEGMSHFSRLALLRCRSASKKRKVYVARTKKRRKILNLVFFSAEPDVSPTFRNSDVGDGRSAKKAYLSTSAGITEQTSGKDQIGETAMRAKGVKSCGLAPVLPCSISPSRYCAAGTTLQQICLWFNPFSGGDSLLDPVDAGLRGVPPQLRSLVLADYDTLSKPTFYKLQKPFHWNDTDAHRRLHGQIVSAQAMLTSFFRSTAEGMCSAM